MQIKDQERFPAVSLAVVIDRSGSMAAQEEGLAKIQLASEGAIRVAELMNDFDEITIIPVDTAADQIIGPAMASERQQIIAQTRLIGAGGGGIFVRTGLEAAVQALSQSENQVKHIILLADGADAEQKEGVPELISSLREQNITVSTVSIGNGPDVQWLEEMALLAGGRFHFTDRAANIPQIFTQETTKIQRSYLVEEYFFPSFSDSPFSANHAIVRSMRESGVISVPALSGYVATAPKTSAQLILESDLGDPILAAWEYGLGRSVAWTSDATGRWATSWVNWEDFSEFWSAVVRWSLSKGGPENFDVDVDFNGIETQITVDAQDRSGRLLNDLKISSSIIDPDGDVQSLTFRQIGPGLYSMNFQPHTEGAYLIRITAESENGQTSMAETTGWVLGYSPEYRQAPKNSSELETLIEITSGRHLKLANDEDVLKVLDHSLQSSNISRPIWSWLLILAIILLPIDVASRRLVVNKRDLKQTLQNIVDRLPSRSVLSTARSEEVARLLQVKKITSSDLTEPSESRSMAETRSRQHGTSQPPVTDQEPDISPGMVEPEQESTDTLASRLLKRKREQSQDDQS
jgi:hypothetical protein